MRACVHVCVCVCVPPHTLRSLPFVRTFPWSTAAEPARVSVPLFQLDFEMSTTLYLVKLWLCIALVAAAWAGTAWYIADKNRLPRIVAASRPPDAMVGTVVWLLVCTLPRHARSSSR